MDRRDFLKKGALAAAGAVVGGSVLSSLMGVSGCSDKPKKKVIGLQLYSLKDAMKEDPAGTLKLIADMGYTELETASYKDGKLYGYAPEEFRKICADLGMNVSSAHINQRYNPERDAEIMAFWDQALDTQAAAGCRYAVLPSMNIGDEISDIQMHCDYFNKVGEMANKKNVKFGFHNHAGEFKKIGNDIVYDYLIQNTDKDKVFYQMDVYWVTKGGYDPVDYLNKYAGRFPNLHIKDESTIGESGDMNFEPIFKAAYAQGMKDFYVEVERYTQTPEICVERSYDFLYGADYVK